MWKKVGWLYIGLYVLGVLIAIIISAQKEIQAGGFDPVTLIYSLVFLFPAGVLAFNLREKKVAIVFTLIGLLVAVVPVVAIFNFNAINLETIGKALIFLPMIVGLLFPVYQRLTVKLQQF
jgi:hypothetical protein